MSALAEVLVQLRDVLRSHRMGWYVFADLSMSRLLDLAYQLSRETLEHSAMPVIRFEFDVISPYA